MDRSISCYRWNGIYLLFLADICECSDIRYYPDKTFGGQVTRCGQNNARDNITSRKRPKIKFKQFGDIFIGRFILEERTKKKDVSEQYKVNDDNNR